MSDKDYKGIDSGSVPDMPAQNIPKGASVTWGTFTDERICKVIKGPYRREPGDKGSKWRYLIKLPNGAEVEVSDREIFYHPPTGAGQHNID